MKRLSLLALSMLLVVLAGCGSSSSSSSSTSSSSSSTSSSSPAPATSTPASGSSAPSGGAAIHVTMKNLAFSPDTITAKVGQTVDWTNNDTPPHNVTYVSGPKFKSSPMMNPGAKFHLKLTQAGTIHYYCTIHPFMKATIVVTK
jgi:amicyanin